MGGDPIETALAAAEAQEPGEGLRSVARLRRRLEELEALHVARAVRDGWSWRRVADSLGVTKQAAHKKHARRLAADAVPPRSAPKRLVVTGRARAAVRLARREAAALGAPVLRSEHLLLGLLRGEAGAVADALARAGVTLARARETAVHLNAGAASGETPPGGGAPLPVSADARAVMEQSLREAVSRRDDHLGTEHLLLALLRAERDGGRTLAGLGVAPDAVERLLDEALPRAPAEAL